MKNGDQYYSLYENTLVILWGGGEKMSFLIAVHVNEGIVLASDRRITYTNTEEKENRIIQRIGIHSTDSTDKTFLCPNMSGISTCGDATLFGRPITGYIQEMIRSRIDKNCDVSKIPGIIIDYFNRFDKVPNSRFIVAGYSTVGKDKKQLIYKVQVASKEIEEINTECQGAIWDGETYTMIRLLRPIAFMNENGEYQTLPQEDILWYYFTLQDAVDFARYAVETTIKTMRFKNVVKTVGGQVDILVITPDGAEWLQKEQLK